MPAATKVSPSKKAGVPKAKGAVRAKSGCYTCRIRRKKCDEQPNADGHCQTCVRLRLQCLGFGAKRPEWLRENRNVVELREKIKTFLAAQGMIKGHSGSGPRSSDGEPVILRLGADEPDPYRSSSSASPPSRTSNLEDYRSHQVSNLRGGWNEPPEHTLYPSHGLHPTHHHHQPRSASPYSSHDSVTHDPLHVSSLYPSNSLVPSSPEPALRSLIAHSYNVDISPESYEETIFFDPDPNTYFDPLSSGSFVTYDHQTFGDPVNHYFNKVLGVQYLLGDKRSLFYIMTNSVYAPNPTACRKAIEMLADVHIRRIQNPNQPALDISKAHKLKRIQTWLEEQESTDPDTAMAALHYISLYLFDGGSGAWEGFLKVAGKYVSKILYHSGYTSPLDALQSCSEKDAFVIKTVLWFDVLASITTQRPPYFFSAIDAMFNPSQIRIENEQSSMMNPMGCENIVLWALTKTSELSYWKKIQQDRGSLSIPDLVKRAGMIEQCLEPSPSSIYNYDPSPSADKAGCSRYYASEIFRTSTLLFLRSVVSGNYPHVKEIKAAVHETMLCIRNIPTDPEIRRSVVRSTVFSFFICGSLTDDHRNLEYLGRILTHESGGESGVGNCNHIYTLLRELWIKRDPNAPGPIEWRECLKQNDSQVLLV